MAIDKAMEIYFKYIIILIFRDNTTWERKF